MKHIMKKEATVKGTKVTARKWEGYGKKKVYFRVEFEGAGPYSKCKQVEWDCQKQDFIYSTRDSFLKSPLVNNIQAAEWEEALKEAFEL